MVRFEPQTVKLVDVSLDRIMNSNVPCRSRKPAVLMRMCFVFNKQVELLAHALHQCATVQVKDECDKCVCV